MTSLNHYDNLRVVANVYRIYDQDLQNDDAFQCGWRMWSFVATMEGECSRKIYAYETNEIQDLKMAGASYLHTKQAEWNAFRGSVLKLLPTHSRESFSNQYRSFFKQTAFVMIDCCFAAKYKIDTFSIRHILSKMFVKTDTNEVPKYFIILDNDIMSAEMNYKLTFQNDIRYRDTIEGISAYMNYQPSFDRDGVVRMSVPFVTTHMALLKAERKAGSIKYARNLSRNNFNDYAQLFLMNYIRKSFQQCARVALLSDDNHFLKNANTFIVSQLDVAHAHTGLPKGYTDTPHIITPLMLDPCDLEEWKMVNKIVN